VSRRIFLRCPTLHRAGFEHGFGTRHSRARSVPGLVTLRQVHGTQLVEARPQEAPVAGDAVWTRQAGVAVGVYTADCVPILLVDRELRAVAAVHAGWRGSAAGISGVVIDALGRDLGISPASWIAVIGPHIGPCCYEVDAPVIRAVADSSVFSASARVDRRMLDLFALNRAQLVSAGVPAGSVYRVPGCTSCDPQFDSYRRDGTGGRMQHYVRMPDARSTIRAQKAG